MGNSLDLYRRLLAVQLRSQLQYRVAFLFDVAATGATTIVEFGALVLVFQRFEQIGGWTLAEVAFLYGMVEATLGLANMLFGGFDADVFSEQVRRGSFDQLLVRPVNITVQVLGSQLGLRRLGRVVQGLLIFAGALVWLEISWTPAKVAYLPLVFASLTAFFGGLFVIGATITFWTVQSVEAMNIFTYGGAGMMAYPMHIYQTWLRRFFTFVVPAIFLNYYPTLYILDKADPLNMPPIAPFLAPVVGAGMLGVAMWFWGFGVRYYQSTGS